MRVLFVSKPIREPFHDGSACLVRDVASNLQRWQARVMGVAGSPPWELGPNRPEVAAVYRDGGRYAPALAANVRAMAYLLKDTSSALWHFVFAPNARSSGVIRWLRRARRVPVVQTVASPPRSFAAVRELLFGDVVVAQSEWTKARIEDAAPDVRVEMIRPPAPQIDVPGSSDVQRVRAGLGLTEEQRVFVYPGDLEFSQGAQVVADAVAPLTARVPNAVVVFSCRRKTPRAVEVEAELARRLPKDQVRFAGELPSLLPLVAGADCVLFPVEDLWAKVDIPIAILESMRLSVPVIVPDRGPLSELVGPLRVSASGEPVAEAAARVVADAALRTEVVACQERTLGSEFDARSVASRYEALYDGICRRA